MSPFVETFPIYDPICVLLETNFGRWKEQDKKDFLNNKKPTNVLNVTKVGKSHDKVFKRNFKQSWYSQFEWLCGSHYLTKLFCVPCLNISVTSGVWNKTGFSDFANVTRALHKHEGSTEHIRCALAFSRLRKNLTSIEDALQENSRLYITRFNENVTLNRRFMQLPIRAALFLGKQELAFCGYHEDALASNRREF